MFRKREKKDNILTFGHFRYLKVPQVPEISYQKTKLPSASVLCFFRKSILLIETLMEEDKPEVLGGVEFANLEKKCSGQLLASSANQLSICMK